MGTPYKNHKSLNHSTTLRSINPLGDEIETCSDCGQRWIHYASASKLNHPVSLRPATGSWVIARWESAGGATVVELHKQDGSGYAYRTNQHADGYLGNDFPSAAAAIEAFEPRVNDFQPDRNITRMRRCI